MTMFLQGYRISLLYLPFHCLGADCFHLNQGSTPNLSIFSKLLILHYTNSAAKVEFALLEVSVKVIIWYLFLLEVKVTQSLVQPFCRSTRTYKL